MRGEIEAWRRPRYDRAPLPAQLWTDALAVAQRIGVNRARLALGLSYCGLQSHVERATAAPEFVELSGAEVLAAAARDILNRTEEAIVTVCRLEEECGTEARSPTTANDARVMKMPDGGFRPGYNIQLAVAGKETSGARTIVGVDVSNLGSDMGAVTKMIDELNAMTGVVPKHILADGNHARHACFDNAAAPGVDVLVAPSKSSKAQAKDSAAVTAWRERMATDDANRRYRLRAALVELANARVGVQVSGGVQREPL